MPEAAYSHVRLRRWRRQQKLDALGFACYDDYLRSSHWQQVRERFREESTEPRDCMCGETDGLQLHHMTYERVGAEELTDLTLLCPKCHAMIHALELRGEIGLDFTGFVNAERAKRYQAENGEHLRGRDDWYIEQQKQKQLSDRPRVSLAKLKALHREAAKKDVDVNDDLDQAITAIKAKLKEKREAT